MGWQPMPREAGLTCMHPVRVAEVEIRGVDSFMLHTRGVTAYNRKMPRRKNALQSSSGFTSGRSAGVLLHITSLPGRFGIGDLGPEAYRWVDWLARAGQ